MTAVPAWQARPQQMPRIPMTIKVKTAVREHVYTGLFSTTFDAYDDALERFGEAVLRIEVSVAQGGSR